MFQLSVIKNLGVGFCKSPQDALGRSPRRRACLLVLSMRYVLLSLILVLPPTCSYAQTVFTTSGIGFAKFFPIGTYLAVGTQDGSIRVINVNNVAMGREIRRFTVPSDLAPIDWNSGAGSYVEISPNGAHLASFLNTGLRYGDSERIDEPVIILWDIVTGHESARLVGHSGPVFSSAFSPDGTYLASRSCDEIRLWDVTKGLEVRRIVRIIEHASGRLCSEGGYAQNHFFPITFSPDGYLAGAEPEYVGGRSYTVRIWDVTTGQEIHKFKMDEPEHAYDETLDHAVSMKYSPDGSFLAISTVEVGGCCPDGNVKIYSSNTGEIRTLGVPTRDSDVSGVSFSPSGSHLAVVVSGGGTGFGVYVYETDNGMYVGESREFFHPSYRGSHRSVYFGDVSSNMRFVSSIIPIDGTTIVSVVSIPLPLLLFEESIQDQNYSRGTPITPLVLPEAFGGKGSHNYTLTPDLPAGLFFHEPARTIFGVPAVVTSTPIEYTYTAIDTGTHRDLKATLSFKISVSEPTSTETTSLPETFTVVGNYPNPFQDETHLTLHLPWPARVEVEILDVTGRRLLTIPENSLEAGWAQTIKIDGSSLSTGFYLYTLTASSSAGSFVQVGQFVKIQ